MQDDEQHEQHEQHGRQIVTLPFERRRSLEWAGETLRDLRSSAKDLELWGGPVPPKLRQMAIVILRHYPTPQQIDLATRVDDKISDWISKEPDAAEGHE